MRGLGFHLRPRSLLVSVASFLGDTYRYVGFTGQQANSTFATNSTKNYQIIRHPDWIMEDCDRLLVWWDNWCVTGNSETVSGLATVLLDKYAVECNGVAVPLTFSGLRTKTLNSGDAFITSDELTAAAFGLTKFSKGTPIFIRGVCHTTGSGTSVTRDRGLANGPSGGVQIPGAAYGIYTSPGDSSDTNQVDSTGSFTPPSGAAYSEPFVPSGIIGRATSSAKSVVALVDSIGDGYLGNNFDGTAGTGGMLRTAAWGAQRPLYMIGKFGGIVAGLTGTNVTAIVRKKYSGKRLFTAGVQQSISNDEGSGLAAIETLAAGVWTMLKDASGGEPIPVYAGQASYPNATATDGATSYANQTKYGSGGQTDLETYNNTWLPSKVTDTTIAGVLYWNGFYSSANGYKYTVPGKTYTVVTTIGAGATTLRITGTTAPVVGDALAFPASNFTDAFVVATVSVVNGTTWDVTKLEVTNTSLDLPATFAAHSSGAAVAATASPDGTHFSPVFNKAAGLSWIGTAPF